MSRGSLRIYLGAAPGVGKTFSMLNEGRRRCERGTDVVVGIVETHGREKTLEQVADLEIVPRQSVEYRGTTFEEMDLAAILARKPEVALVDELAHTNVPGSKNEKRWQDVDELLDAGIDVISTLNIQHLESLNDVVERITGIAQRETIPDEVARRADQIELVDMSPEALRRRMAHGNVYPAERIDAALGNYFREGNLGALRELALLWVADRVDETLDDYRRLHGIERPWETRERVVVALTGAADGDRLVRRAARMAHRAKGDLIAVHVRPQDGLAGSSADALAEQRALVERLQGSYREIVGDDVGLALVGAARAANATQIVLGATRRSRWRELTQGSVITSVIRASGEDLDVHVISNPDGRVQGATSAQAGRPATATPRHWCRDRGDCAAGLDRRPRRAARSARAAKRVVAVPAHRRDRLCRGWGLARTCDRGRRVLACQLVLHPAAPHVHDRGVGEPARARGLPHRRGHRERARLARRPACGRGSGSPRRGRDAWPDWQEPRRSPTSSRRSAGCSGSTA